MARCVSRLASVSACLAALSMAATPAFAAPLGIPAGSSAPNAAQGWDVAGETAHNHRGWGGYRRHRGGVDTGDVIAGVLILGGIAAIASAASKNKRDRDGDYRSPDYRAPDNRDRDYRAPDYRSGDRPYDYRDDDDRADDGYGGDRGLDRAVDVCVREVEKREQVDKVDSVDRTTDGWRVEGELRNGRDFACEVGGDGQIRDVDLDADLASASEPASDEQSDGQSDSQEDDGRYRTADVPDFQGGV